MKDVALARDIVRAMRAAVDIPFTVKMRAGWDVSLKNARMLRRCVKKKGPMA